MSFPICLLFPLSGTERTYELNKRCCVQSSWNSDRISCTGRRGQTLVSFKWIAGKTHRYTHMTTNQINCKMADNTISKVSSILVPVQKGRPQTWLSTVKQLVQFLNLFESRYTYQVHILTFWQDANISPWRSKKYFTCWGTRKWSHCWRDSPLRQ